MGEKSSEEQLEHFRVRFSATIGTAGTKNGVSMEEAIINFRCFFFVLIKFV